LPVVFLMALVIAGAAGAMTSAGAAPRALCASSALVLPPLSGAGYEDFRAVCALVDAQRLHAARARWASLTGWSSADRGTAYGGADAAFSAHAYRTAFRLYYRALFCGSFSELNPSADDSGAAASLASALQRAANGDLAAAQHELQGAAERDPASIESRYFLGLVQRARGHRDAARAAWKAAIDDAGYAQPPDGWTLPRAQQAALQRYLSTEPAR
jgi:hypothetical protein